MAELILAAKRGIYHRVLAELREGAFVNSEDSDGATPLYWAACGGHWEICRLLLSREADVKLAVKWGSTPLHAAAYQGHTDCIMHLLRYGADVNAQNDKGDTPLHLASLRGEFEACKILLSHGANPDILNNHGKSSHQEAEGAQHKDITKIFSEKKPAHRASSYPLTTAANREAATTTTLRLRQHVSDSDDSLLRTKKTSLRKNLLASSLEKQVEMNERPGTKPIPTTLNQLSQKPVNPGSHHHHRPFSDPTPSLPFGPFNIKEFSDPAKVSNIISDETDFQHRQEETERDHYISVIDSLQLKMALLTSQKEALEMQLREGGGSPSHELIRKELEQKLQGTTEELQRQRQERRASDAKNRQLLLQLFHLKSQQRSCRRHSLDNSSTNSSFQGTSLATDSLISEYNSLCHRKQNAEGSLTWSICSCLQKPYLCQDSSLQHVFALMQEGKAAIPVLKVSTTKRLDMIRASLNETKEEFSDEPGKQWTLEEDYKILHGRPVDRDLKHSEDGFISQMCLRVVFKNQTYIMKVLMNHRRSPKPSSHACSADMRGVEFSILESLHDAPHPHITRIYHHFDIQTSELRKLLDMSTLLDSTLSSQLAERSAMVIFPDYSTTLDHLVSSLRANNSSSANSTWIQPPNEALVLRLLMQLLKALLHLRNQGVAHRDINSKAVVVDWNMRLVLGEFGYARKLLNDEGQGIPFVEKSQIGAGNRFAWSPELLQFSINGPPKSWQKVLTLVDVYESSDMYSAIAMMCDLFADTSADDGSPPSPGMTAKSLPMVAYQPPKLLSSEGQALFARILSDNPAERPTLTEAMLRGGMLLYGPRRAAVNSSEDVEAWLQAQEIKMLAIPPQLNTSELDELARRLDWELCHDYIHSVSPSELWQLCSDPLAHVG